MVIAMAMRVLTSFATVPDWTGHGQGKMFGSASEQVIPASSNTSCSIESSGRVLVSVSSGARDLERSSRVAPQS